MLLTLALTSSLLPACAQGDTADVDEPEAQDLRAFFEGAGPIPDAAARDEHRRTLALLSVRASGARRSGVKLDPEEAWAPVVEQAGSTMVPVDTRAWQRQGDIDRSGAFVPLRLACPPREEPLDLTAVPDEVRGPLLEERAARVACALERAAGADLAVEWAPRLPYAAVIDEEEGMALVNPRLLALVEPDGDDPVETPFAAPIGPPSPPGSAHDDPGAKPLSNDHHPRPPEGGSGGTGGSGGSGGSSRTFCDRVCDDVWNDLFDCDCDGSTGSGNDCDCNSPGADGCDCGGSPGSSAGACRCGHAGRGSRDRNGVLTSCAFAGTLMLRRARKLREPARRLALWLARALRIDLIVFLMTLVAALIAGSRAAVAAPPPKLVDVAVSVSPPEAAVFVDGNAVVPTNGVVRVPAGKHTFTAKLDGYAAAEQTVDVPTSGTGTLVTLRLVPDKGYLVITGSDPATALLIDGSPAGKGSYSGLVAPGNHVITAVDARGYSRSYLVTSVAGQSMTVSVDAPPNYFPPPPPQPEPPPPPPVKKEPPRPRIPPTTGPYAFVNVTLVWQTARPYAFEHGDTPAPGFSIGGRAGYRINDIVGVEGLLEYGRIENGGFVVQQYDVDRNNDGVVSGGEAAVDRGPGYYLLESVRIGPVLRLTSNGKVNRFVGGIGLGAVHENIALEHRNLVWSSASDTYVAQGVYRHNYEGWSPYFLLEAGYERSIDAFLAGILGQIIVESVSGIGGDPYNSGAQARLGLTLRFGYSLW